MNGPGNEPASGAPASAPAWQTPVLVPLIDTDAAAAGKQYPLSWEAGAYGIS